MGFNCNSWDVYHNVPEEQRENIWVTLLAMTCGLLYVWLQGNALLVWSFGGQWEDLPLDAIEEACCISLDLPPLVQEELAKEVAVGVLFSRAKEL